MLYTQLLFKENLNGQLIVPLKILIIIKVILFVNKNLNPLKNQKLQQKLNQRVKQDQGVGVGVEQDQGVGVAETKIYDG